MEDKELKNILIYDVNSLPPGWNLEKVVSIYEKRQLVIYDSRNGGVTPYMTNNDPGSHLFLDLSNLTEKEREEYGRNND